MHKQLPYSWLLGVASLTVAPTGCAPPVPQCPPAVILPAPVAAIPAPQMPVASRHKRPLAVLPIEDAQLFRSERSAVRGLLASTLAQHALDYRVLPLSTVDSKLRPVSKAGERCAFEGTPFRRQVSSQGWHATELTVVHNVTPKPAELWVKLGGKWQPEVLLAGIWNSKLPRMQRYQSALAQLRPLQSGGGVLGALSGRPSFKHAARGASLTLCELEDRFLGDCAPHSTAWRDRFTEVAACYAGQDHTLDQVLVDTAAAPPRCEMTNLEQTSGPVAERERCLCAALLSSAGVTMRTARRKLRIEHEAADLSGKRRPQIRVVEVSENLHAEHDWHRYELPITPLRSASSMSSRRLVVDNLDAVTHPLARCRISGSGPTSAELTVAASGVVTAQRIFGAGKLDQATRACLTGALSRARFACTRDGKTATLKVAFWWP